MKRYTDNVISEQALSKCDLRMVKFLSKFADFAFKSYNRQQFKVLTDYLNEQSGNWRFTDFIKYCDERNIKCSKEEFVKDHDDEENFKTKEIINLGGLVFI